VGFTSWANVKGVRVNDALVRRLVYGRNAMLVESQMAAGSCAPDHAHPHEQLLYVGEGLIEVTIGDERRMMSVGDVGVIPSNCNHAVKVVSAGGAVVYDVFSPIREDFIEEAARADLQDGK
jgi:quercetin dioxygenase-like cupin family protein